jgi:hypothetical protein
MFSRSFGGSANEIGAHPNLLRPLAPVLAWVASGGGNGKETRQGVH